MGPSVARLVPAASVVTIVAIWIADTSASADVRFGFLYMLPLAGSAWWGSRRIALICATVASVALVTNDLALRPDTTLLTNIWNELTRVITFYAIVLFISSVRHSAERARRESARAFQLAVTDQLTGLYNRHYLNEQLQRLHPAAVRRGRPYAILALDLDGLKQINDTSGHAAGDAALVAFAEQLTLAVRADDIAVRTGGDEFVILLPDATVSDAVALSMRLQTAIRDTRGRDRIRALSAGAVVWKPQATIAGLIAEADALVYQSKRAGGGRVTAAEEAEAG
jgi:diguanylate cyclase (GGDEF)-like protein